MEDRSLLDIPETADELRVSTATIKRLIKDGNWLQSRLGGVG